MIIISTRILACIIVLSFCTCPHLPAAPAEERLSLAQIFTDNMVLQRNTPVQVWGSAVPGARVTVSFAGQKETSVTGRNGKWTVSLTPLKADATGQRLTVTATGAPEETLLIENVAIGDVWICAGQSNMARSAPSALDPQKTVANANCPSIRHVSILNRAGIHPVDDVIRASKWLPCSPRTVGAFTAVGYFFGRTLHEELEIPIGLINVSWSGSAIEPWIPREAYESSPKLIQFLNRIDQWDSTSPKGAPLFAHDLAALRQWVDNAELLLETGEKIPQLPVLKILGAEVNGPTHYYNGLIHGLTPYPIRGVIWYQGESNSRDGLEYFPKLKALIEGWRTAWNQKDLPFYVVQLPNYGPDSRKPEGGDGWARIREAELKVLELPHTGLAVTIDIGIAGNLHPPNKNDVGLRLALSALSNTYGKELVGSGPLYREMKIENNTIRLFFSHVGSGLMVGEKNGTDEATEMADGTLQCFSIMDRDGSWHWADAIIDGTSVVVSSKQAIHPVAVRYAFSASPVGANLYNREGLPASPFRTDTPAAELEARRKQIRESRESTYDSTFKIPPEWVALHDPTPVPVTNWIFRPDPLDCGIREEWYTDELATDRWFPIPVPAFWIETAAGDFQGTGWYRSVFTLPADWQGKPVRLLFGSVDEEAWVYVNGQLVGEHTVETTELPLGTIWEIPFDIAIPTRLLHVDRANTLAVRVLNRKVNGGIWRPVLLHAEEAR